MKVVLDTNVIIAAFATNGICQALFEVCVDQHEICINEFIVSEVREKLQSKLKMPQTSVTAITEYLRDHALVVAHGKLPKGICRDPDDDWILALAEAAEASFLVTGDDDLLTLGSHGTTSIVTPRAFWEALRQHEPETREK